MKCSEYCHTALLRRLKCSVFVTLPPNTSSPVKVHEKTGLNDALFSSVAGGLNTLMGQFLTSFGQVIFI